jgi:hypothetical protein
MDTGLGIDKDEMSNSRKKCGEKLVNLQNPSWMIWGKEKSGELESNSYTSIVL